MTYLLYLYSIIHLYVYIYFVYSIHMFIIQLTLLFITFISLSILNMQSFLQNEHLVILFKCQTSENFLVTTYFNKTDYKAIIKVVVYFYSSWNLNMIKAFEHQWDHLFSYFTLSFNDDFLSCISNIKIMTEVEVHLKICSLTQ